MSGGTSLLFHLPGFRVVSCEEDDPGMRRLVVMQVADEHACPRCGVLVCGEPYNLRDSLIKDLPIGQWPLEVIWPKRQYRCAEPGCVTAGVHRAVRACVAAAAVEPVDGSRPAAWWKSSA